MGMKNNAGSVNFLYGNWLGRGILKIIMKLRLDRIAVKFLWSSLSKPMVKRFVKKNGIAVTDEECASFGSFRELFVRTRDDLTVDPAPDHLISPCDSRLSVFPIDENSCFALKNSHYRIRDFLQDEQLAARYLGGTCLIFRLCVSDYHHYGYIDDAYQGANHAIPGVLHSVQPIACETYPVFVLNKRSWCLLETDHFGPVVQCEIGAMVVGGIVNEKENTRVRRGEEKGRFELSGSTIVLLFEKNRIELRPELTEALRQAPEVPVKWGEWIGNAAEEML